MMIAGSIASFAAVVKDTEVTVNGLLPNDVVKFYQVLTWNQTAGEWQLAEGFTTLKLTDNASETQADTVAAIVDGITQAEARKIAALTNLASGGPTAKNTVTVGEGGTSATYAIPTGDENLGLYMGVITAGDPGYININSEVLFMGLWRYVICSFLYGYASCMARLAQLSGLLFH